MPPVQIMEGEPNYVIHMYGHTFEVPHPQALKLRTIHAFLHEMVEVETEIAAMLERCDFSYESAPDWENPGRETLGLVLYAPPDIYQTLKADMILFGEIIGDIQGLIVPELGAGRLVEK